MACFAPIKSAQSGKDLPDGLPVLYTDEAAQAQNQDRRGGAVGIGTYYALQYGFYGLGLVLDLKLLGVSREYELEADQLGIQYTWNTGYDPSGFVRFFDKMATQEGRLRERGGLVLRPPPFLSTYGRC